MNDAQSQALQFLDSLFDQALDEDQGAILIWTIDAKDRSKKISRFFTSTTDAAKYAVERAPGCDVYFGTTVQPLGLGDRDRGKISNVTAMVALQTDIDIAGPGHKGKRYANDLTEAIDIIKSIGPEPTWIINSGGGVHAYWVFSEPWSLINETERDGAVALSYAWNMTAKSAANVKGVGVDSTFDLARVLRVPGTFNHKLGTPRPVEIIHFADENRYHIEAFDDYLVDVNYVKEDAPVKVDDLTLVADCPVPECVQDALEDSLFQRTWERKRRDLFDDQSASSYDYAIINFGVGNGWGDQEIADAVINWRRKHNEDLEKVTRRNYLTKSIGKCRADRKQVNAVKQMEVEGLPSVGPLGPTQAQRDRAMKRLSDTFGRQVKRFTKLGRENAMYTLEFEPNLVVPIGPASAVTSHQRMVHIFFDHDIHMEAKAKQWPTICKHLLFIVEEIENEESSHVGEAVGWIQRYLSTAVIHCGEEWTLFAKERRPCVYEDQLWINLMSLHAFVTGQLGVRIKPHELFHRLGLIGFVADKVWVPMPYEEQVRMWRIAVHDAIKLSLSTSAKLGLLDGKESLDAAV